MFCECIALGATNLCEMNLVPIAETVLQLQGNWYLIHSPVSLTSRIDCLNSSASEVFIRRGASKIHVSPTCRLHLTSHVLISNFEILAKIEGKEANFFFENLRRAYKDLI